MNCRICVEVQNSFSATEQGSMPCCFNGHQGPGPFAPSLDGIIRANYNWLVQDLLLSRALTPEATETWKKIKVAHFPTKKTACFALQDCCRSTHCLLSTQLSLVKNHLFCPSNCWQPRSTNHERPRFNGGILGLVVPSRGRSILVSSKKKDRG